MLAGNMLRLPARRFPDKTALIGVDGTLTFRELDEAADRFASALAAVGIAKGDRIAVMMPNITLYPAIHFGAARTGAVLGHLSYRYAAKDLIYAINKTAARLLIVDAQFADLVSRFVLETPTLEQIVVVGDGGGDLPKAIAYEEFVAAGNGRPPKVELHDEEGYSVTFTGGTTGFPKAVVVSHKCRTTSAVTIVAEHGLSHEDRAAIVTPLFHAAGLFVWFQPVLWLGCTCSLLPTWDPVAFMEMVERDGVTAVFMVPTQLNGLIKHPQFDPARIRSLTNIGYAGSPMPRSLLAELRRLMPQAAFTENYGQSETGPMTMKRHWEYDRHPDSVGRPSFNVETTVFGPDGKEMPPGETGEIVTRGDHLLVEYYDDPEQTQALFKSGDGWLWTGDLGFRDEEGFITLVDRSKDMIISGAENIYPKEIEDVLYRHEAVVECAVFGIPDEHWGEVPAAHVVLKAGVAVTAEELTEFSLEYLARFKRPRLIEFVDGLPKTPVGKIQKHLIRAPYWKDRDRKI